MKKAFQIILSIITICTANYAFSQTSLPMVIKNTYFSGYSPNLNIRNAAGTVITSIPCTSTFTGRLVATEIVSGELVTSPANSQVTSTWYHVDLPGTTSAVTGYCAAGSTFSNPECFANYITVGSYAVYIRTGPGTGNVTIGSGGGNAFVFPGQNFAVCSTATISSITYYQISLPNNCYNGSSITNLGWVSSGSGGALVSSHVSSNNALPSATTPYVTGITTTTAGLNWGILFYPSKTSFKIYSAGGDLLGTDTDSNPLASSFTPASYTLSSLTSNTSYTIYVQAIYNSSGGVCVSNLSPTSTFTTTCTGTAPVANFTPSSYTALTGNAISITNTSTGTPTYSWTASPTTGVSFSNPSAATPTITFTNTGTYTITLLATNSCGSSSVSQIITVNPATSPPVANFEVSSDSINPGRRVFTENTSLGVPAPTFTWSVTPSIGVTISSLPTNPTFRFAKTGTYTIALTATNIHGSSIVFKTIHVSYAINNNPCQIGFPSYMALEPVDVALGSFKYKHTDFNIPAVNSFLNFTRFYNSRNNALPGSFGYGWSHSFDYEIVNQGDSLWNVHYGDGHNNYFIPDGNGSGISYPYFGGTFEKLFRNPSTKTYTLTFKNKDVYNFDSSGKFISIVDLNGNITSLNYVGGNLTSIIAPGGRKLTLTYTSLHINTVTDPLGRTIIYNYDGSGNLTLVTNASWGATGYAYDGSNRITQIVTPNGNSLLTNTYDGENRVISQTDANGQVSTIAYNTPGTGDSRITYPDGSYETVHHDSYYRLTQRTDELSYNKLYSYDINNNIISTTDENGNVTTFSYDSVGNNLNIHQPLDANTQILYSPTYNKPISFTDPLGNTTGIYYDVHGNDTAIHLPNGASKIYTYYSSGQKHTSSDAYGRITTYSYSYRGDLLSVTSPSGSKTFTYDSSGRCISKTDENGHTSSITYNNNDMVTKVTDALGKSITDSFDADNNLIYTTDKNGNYQQLNYDAEDRLVSVTDAMGGIKSFSYDSRDNLITVTDANSHSVSFGYNAKKQLISTTNSLGTTNFGYDGVGNLILETDATGFAKHYSYDELNHRIAVADELGNTANYTNNKLGQITVIQDPNGKTTNYYFNSLGLNSSIQDANGISTSVGFDLNGRRTSITDPNGNSQYFRYNASGWVDSFIDGAGNVFAFAYDSAGNLTNETKPGGGTIVKTYNAVNKVTNVINSTGDNYTYKYDANGNLDTVINTTGTSAFVYDSLNHLKKYTDMFGNIVQYTYDLAGNKKSIIYPGSHVVSYNYNNDNMLDSVTDWLGHITGYNYDADGRLAGMIYPNGTITNYTYDNASRLISQLDSLPSNPIYKSIFTLDANGIRTQEQRKGAAPSHLSAASYANSFGNDDRLTNDSITAYINSTTGNRTSETNTTGTTTYSFSVDNILNSFTTPILGTTTYQYDALGNRVKKTQGGITRRFVLDLSSGLSQVLMEQDNTGVVKVNYIYGLGLIARIDSTGSNIQYYHFDAQYNTVALSNQSGLITDTYTYDPFGAMLKHLGTTNQPYTFIGQYGVQQETPNLFFARARYYDATNGRFMSKDPYPASLPNPQTLNRYVYGVNNPISNYDPLGLFNWSAFGIGLLQITAGVGNLAEAALSIEDGPVGVALAGQAYNDYNKNFEAAWSNIINSGDNNYEWKQSDDFSGPLDYFYNDPIAKKALLVASLFKGIIGVGKAGSISLEFSHDFLGIIQDFQTSKCGN